jgi:DNA-binding NtrC family response regulator
MSGAPSASGAERVLVVEDDTSFREVLTTMLEGEGYEVAASPNVPHALGVLAGSRVDLMVTDLAMPTTRGEVLVARVRVSYPHVPVIVITGFGSVSQAVELVRAGAADYLAKPFGTESFLRAVARVLGETRLERLRARTQVKEPNFLQGIVGRSRPMLALFEQMQRIARTHAPVLITGETGTGKELIATALHRASGRSPFVPLNCAAIPAQLLESELFGHVRGAFTGANRDKVGLFEVASGGTLFLDEIAELPLALQPKLLRALQEGEIRRVGDVDTHKVHVRIVAATHRELRGEIDAGRFREDLFFRLNVLHLDVPALRDRSADIPLLADRFLDKITEREGWSPMRFAPDALSALVAHPWPGNVRELQNVVERAAMLADGAVIQPVDLPDALRQSTPPLSFAARTADRTLSLDEMERAYAREVLGRHGGNKMRAAAALGISRRSLYRLLENRSDAHHLE